MARIGMAAHAVLRRTYGKLCRASRSTLDGWVQRARDLGGVIFVWLRDRDGSGAGRLQPRSRAIARDLRPWAAEPAQRSTLCRLHGRSGACAPKRPSTRQAQDRQDRGDRAKVRRSSTSREPRRPSISTITPMRTRLMRLKYRYLDLRKPSHAARTCACARRSLSTMPPSHGRMQGFTEVETPILIEVHARGRARLPRAQPRAARRVLRPAPERRRFTSSF